MPQIITYLNCKLCPRYSVKDVSGSYTPNLGGELAPSKDEFCFIERNEYGFFNSTYDVSLMTPPLEGAVVEDRRGEGL